MRWMLLLCLFVTGCAQIEENMKKQAEKTKADYQTAYDKLIGDDKAKTTTTNVVRVFFHQTNNYSVFVHVNGEELVHQYVPGKVTIRTDAKKGEPMSMDVWHSDTSIYVPDYGSTYYFATIHVHDPREIDGGSFSYREGKVNRTATTQVVE